VPVLNREGQFYGFAEESDIVTYIMNTLFHRFEETELMQVSKVLDTTDRFQSAVIADVMKYPVRLRSSIRIMYEGCSLFQAWEILALDGVHRVPVLDRANNIVDIVTQSMVIDFLWQNIEKLGSLANAKVGDLFARKDVISVYELDKAHVAFRRMISNNVSGLAVINMEGRLTGNISQRDFRGVHVAAGAFWKLWSTVKDFKTQQASSIAAPVKVLFALESDTLFSVVEKMAVQHVHRIHVVQSTASMLPVSVISQTDILRTILRLEGGSVE